MDLDEYRRLSKSKFKFIDGVPHKSCPQCSLETGDFVYHPSSGYGFREMPGGKRILQSWCSKCIRMKLKLIREQKKLAQEQEQKETSE